MDGPVDKLYEKGIIKVATCPYESAKDLIAYATDTHFVILSTSERPLRCLQEFATPNRVSSISWSPESVYSEKDAKFCGNIVVSIACQDKMIYLYQTTGVEVLEGHRDYIGFHSFSPFLDESKKPLLASVSVRVWKCSGRKYQEAFSSVLDSPGVSVEWHSEKQDCILVSEIGGIIRIIDYQKKETLHYIYTNLPGSKSVDAMIFDCHWNPFDSNKVLAAIGSKWYVWDVNEGISAIADVDHSNVVGNICRWSFNNPFIFAVSKKEKCFSIKNIAYPNMEMTFELPYTVKSIDFTRNNSLAVTTGNGIAIYTVK